MNQFKAEVGNFKRGVGELLQELEEAYEELREAETEEYLHRLIAYITDFSYLVEGASDEQMAYINNDWPIKYFAELCGYYTEMVSKIDGEFRQIFKMEYNELLSRMRFYIKIPEAKISKKAKSNKGKSSKNRNRQKNKHVDSSHPYYGIINAKEDIRKSKLISHFDSWAVTPFCKQMLAMIIDSVVECTVEGDDLKLDFSAQDDGVRRVRFGPGYPGDFDSQMVLPDSYKVVVTLHNEIMFGRGLPEGVHFLGYEQGPQCEFDAPTFKADPKRFIGFCDIGYDWIVWDKNQLNLIGEPKMVLVRHNHPISTAKEFPSQDSIAYGTGGLIIRCIGYYLFPRATFFRGYCWD